MSESRAAPNQAAAEILQALRKLAGFRSATAAADHYGWPASRYRSHESGARAILESDAVKYAEAFRVEAGVLIRPNLEFLTKISARAETLGAEARKSRAARLRCARVLAGFDSGRDAAEAWGWASATYAKHESATNDLLPGGVEMYALAFGVRPEWLRDGQPPSGLGQKIDREMKRVLMAPQDFRQALERELPPADPAKVSKLKDSITPGRPGALVTLKECSWKDLEAAGGDISKVESLTVWKTPPSFAPRGAGVFVVTIEVVHSRGPEREWLIVSPTLTEAAGQQFLTYENGRLKLSGPSERASRSVIGVLLGRLRSPLSVV